MPVQEDFIEQAAPFRSELLAHCYRLLGSVHEAEDLVQETYLRGWRGYESFEGRAALRTWLYRIATRACLRALENRARRVLPARLGEGSTDPDMVIDDGGGGYHWMEPLPDSLTPDEAAATRDTVRLAVATALQELPARQRAVLILRDVAQFSAAEVAELLSTTPAAVNSAMQRARAHLAEVAPSADTVALPTDRRSLDLIERYCAAFENADLAALTELLRTDIALEMPPFTAWFRGREAVTRFLASRAFGEPGTVLMVPVRANGQDAAADYRRGPDGVHHAHALHVLTEDESGSVSAITVFLDAKLFSAFGLAATR